MSLSSERFSAELSVYQKSHDNITIENLVDELMPQKKYYREAFTRFKNGKAKLKDDDLRIFSKLFNVRGEYLAGIDDYRTTEDRDNAQRKSKSLASALHQIILALGYADLEMEEKDYNPTFPLNTREFLEGCKEGLIERGVSLLCNVNEDTFVSVLQDYYAQFQTDIIEYIIFKLERLFANAKSIPTCVMEDESFLIHPSTTVKQKDGSSITINMRYTPNAYYDNSTLKKAFTLTENKKR